MEKLQEFKNIPTEVWDVSEKLKKAGFEAYLIGGCVRDILLNIEANDWDITTNAKPEEIISTFEETFYENTYGTVGIVNKETKNERVKVIEVTPYRLEAEYSDNRRPDSVTFSQNLEDDLKRRDFTINAIALTLEKHDKKTEIYKGHIVDLYKGQEDLKNKVVRTVGDPNERFGEDGLRILRAVRIANYVGFKMDKKTEESVKNNSKFLEKIAKERIRDEFTKIIMSQTPMKGILKCYELDILKYIIPELEKTISIEQKGSHIYDVWEHSLRSLQHSADKNLALEIRLAALLHDIGKPKSRRAGVDGEKWTFYGHDVISGRMTEKILENLKFSKKIIEKTVKLVRYHMFFSDTEQITLSAVRRIIAHVGKENIWDLIELRTCDRIGMGRPKEDPYRLRKYMAMIEEAMRDPISVGMLKIDGKKIMEVTEEKPGPKIGFVLHALLEEVLDNPKLNTEEYLEDRAKDFIKLPIEDLEKIGKEGKKKKDEEERKEVGEIRKRHWVK